MQLNWQVRTLMDFSKIEKLDELFKVYMFLKYQAEKYIFLLLHRAQRTHGKALFEIVLMAHVETALHVILRQCTYSLLLLFLANRCYVGPLGSRFQIIYSTNNKRQVFVHMQQLTQGFFFQQEFFSARHPRFSRLGIKTPKIFN